MEILYWVVGGLFVIVFICAFSILSYDDEEENDDSQLNSSNMDSNYWFVCYVKQSVNSGDVLSRTLGHVINGPAQFQSTFISDGEEEGNCFEHPFQFIQKMNAEDKENHYVLVNFMQVDEDEYEMFKPMRK